MKTKILLAVMLAVSGVAGAAAGGPASGAGLRSADAGQQEKTKKTGLGAVLEQIDPIDREIMEEEANYWAWRVSVMKDTSYEELRTLSKRWIMKPDTRDILFSKIKRIVDLGRVRPLTAAEKDKMEGGKARIRALLAPGSQDKKLIADLSVDYCIELDSRYWAKRVQDGEKDILEKMHHWSFSPDVKARLIAGIEAKMKLENEPLNKEELYKLDACTEKLK